MIGRDRKDGDRYPSGQLVHREAPNREPKAIEDRRILVGGFPDPDDCRRNCDPFDKRAGSPLGILFLRGAIMGGDYAAGMRFARLYTAIWGNAAIRSHLDDGGCRGLSDDDPERERRRIADAGELGEATALLLALPSRRPYEVLTNLAIYQQPMRFMDTNRASSPEARLADQVDLAALTEATGALAVFWKIERRSV